MRYPLGVIFTCVRWYAACPLKRRHIEEMVADCGVGTDHAVVHRWVGIKRGVRSRKRRWTARI